MALILGPSKTDIRAVDTNVGSVERQQPVRQYDDIVSECCNELLVTNLDWARIQIPVRLMHHRKLLPCGSIKKNHRLSREAEWDSWERIRWVLGCCSNGPILDYLSKPTAESGGKTIPHTCYGHSLICA
jgi:hypothetical protein